jgi:RNA polymerase primary sigma factor
MDIKERNELVKEHLPFIRMIASKYHNIIDKEDLIQEGVLGLMRATETFDESRNIKFLTYASYWIKAYIGRYLTKGQKHLPTEDMEELNTTALTETVEADMIYQDLQEKTYDELTKSGVKTRDLDIVLSRYLSEEPCTLQELGDKYGVSRQRIKQIEERMIKKIKEKLKD